MEATLTTPTNDRRQFWRAHFQSSVQLTVNGRVAAAELCDISLNGALVEVSAEWSGRLNDPGQLQLHLGADAIISMEASIAHIEGRHIGLRCEKIDLDSVTHLRRLVELNSGDPHLLDRELTTLLHKAD
jgi:hypothetical protein